MSSFKDSYSKKPSRKQIKRLPKVLLHDHLDGGLRPTTVIEIAQRIGYELPTYDPQELAVWFEESCSSGSLERYLETFKHTVALMQQKDDIIRVAKECVLDLAEDSVVYAEIRGAPELHTNEGLTLDEVIEATLEGYRLGMEEVKASGRFIRVQSILCALRQNNLWQTIAEKCIKYRDLGVVGFDIAGPEHGFPPAKHVDTFNYLHQENFQFTIHAGEAYGLPSIWQAIQFCGATRLGHGVRIMDDIDLSAPVPKLGRLANYVKDRRIPLEICPQSNLQTGAVKNLESHPIGILTKLRFRITINTDNRLMSKTTMTDEIHRVSKTFGWTYHDILRVTANGMKSAFIPYDERAKIIEEVIKPGFELVADDPTEDTEETVEPNRIDIKLI
jgi:adenosine deaminase